MRDRPTDVARRKLLRHALGAAAGLTVAAAPSARAQHKMSKVEAAYQDTPRNGQQCGFCSFFEEPRSCRIVEGEIGVNGWCKAFDMVD